MPTMAGCFTHWRCSAAGGTTSNNKGRLSRTDCGIVRSRMPSLDSPADRPLVWLLMGTRAGVNRRMLALACAFGWPFEEKHIGSNQLRRVPALRKGLAIVARHSRPLINPPWPDLVIAVGYGSVPVA